MFNAIVQPQHQIYSRDKPLYHNRKELKNPPRTLHTKAQRASIPEGINVCVSCDLAARCLCPCPAFRLCRQLICHDFVASTWTPRIRSLRVIVFKYFGNSKSRTNHKGLIFEVKLAGVLWNDCVPYQVPKYLRLLILQTATQTRDNQPEYWVWFRNKEIPNYINLMTKYCISYFPVKKVTINKN